MNEITVAYRFGTGRFIAAYLVTMRPYLMFVSGITGIAGMAFVAGIPPRRALLIAMASFLSYGFGQALTDCFQIDTDSLSAPYRPLTQGVVSRFAFMGVSVAGLTFCIGIMGYFDPLNFLLGLVAGIGLATYTPFKRRWWGGPFYNAWIVCVLFVIAWRAGNAQRGTEIAEGFWWILGAVFFGYANFVLSGYFKDIEADGATGYRTLVVVFGRKVGAWVSDGFAVLAILCIVLGNVNLYNKQTATGFGNLFALGVAMAGILVSVRSQILLHRVRTDSEAHRPIVLTVHSYVLLLSSTIMILQPEWMAAITGFYVLFVIVLRCRPAVEQI